MRAIASSVLVLAALPGIAAAHHSFFGRFDTQRLVELEGEVTDVLWRNPHAYFNLRADGVDWEIETSSLTVLKRMGIEEGTIRVGDRIRVAANPPAGAKREMYARHVLLADGRELLLNVGLAPRWTSRDRSVGDEALLMARAGDGSRPDLGIFRVWSHTRTIARLFPEVTDSSADINAYPLTPAARAELARFDRSTDNPTANCVPKGMPTIMEAPYPIEFVRHDNGDILLKLEEYDLTRYIYMNPNVARELTATDAARRLHGALGRCRARRDDETNQLAVLQPARHSSKPRRRNRRTVHADGGRQPPRLRDDGHRSRDVHAPRRAAPVLAVAAERDAVAVRVHGSLTGAPCCGNARTTPSPRSCSRTAPAPA